MKSRLNRLKVTGYNLDFFFDVAFKFDESTKIELWYEYDESQFKEISQAREYYEEEIQNIAQNGRVQKLTFQNSWQIENFVGSEDHKIFDEGLKQEIMKRVRGYDDFSKE